MLTVQLFCLPCLIFPAILLAAQFVYNRVGFVKAMVQWLFPSLALAEANAKRTAEEENERKQKEFFGSGSATTTPASAAATTSDAAGSSDGTANGSTSNKKKQ